MDNNTLTDKTSPGVTDPSEPGSAVVQSQGDTNIHQNVLFGDSNNTYSTDIHSRADPTYDDSLDTSADLGDFLSRPTKIAEYTWAAFTDFFETTLSKTLIDPWTLWQSDARVKAKLENFAFLRCDLCVKFVVNGTPFHYGRMMVSYCPYSSNNTLIQDMMVRYAGVDEGTRECTWRYLSTYPNAYLDPCSNEPVVLRLPFVYHNNYIPINGNVDDAKVSLGSLFFNSLNELRVANTNCPQNVSIAVFAWAENVKLTGLTEFVPTSDSSSKDEYADKPVSTTASAIAAGAHALNDTPVIGPFAMATEIGANAVGDMAKLFGFSAPSRQPGDASVQLAYVSNFATTRQVDNAESLALDPKQEVTIDPSTVGYGGSDEMEIKNLITRYQWVTKGLWKSDVGQSTIGGTTKIIAAANVNPELEGVSTSVGVNASRSIMKTPAGHIGRLFTYWKGGMTFKVECICTQKHSGKLLIQFDPFIKNGAEVDTDYYTDEVNARQTAILDLQKSSSIEFKIDYMSYKPYLRITPGLPPETAGAIWPSHVSDQTFDLTNRFNQQHHMGVFVVSVLNDLVAPIATDGSPSATKASIDVNIWAKANEDMEFFGPQSGWEHYSFRPTSSSGVADIFEPFTPFVAWDSVENDPVQTDQFIQFLTDVVGPILHSEYYYGFEPTSEEVSEDVYTNTKMTHSLVQATKSECNAKVFAGERVVSLRTLLKRRTRTVFFRPFNTVSRTNLEDVKITLPMYPWEVLAGSTTRSNTYQSYLCPMFLCQRGGFRYTLTWGTTAKQRSNGAAYASRKVSASSITIGTTVTSLDTMTNDAASDHFPSGHEGMILAASQYRPSIEFTLPWYANSRFDVCVDVSVVASGGSYPIRPTLDVHNYAEVHVSGVAAGEYFFDIAGCVGEDYSLMFFLGVPPVYTE